MARTEKPCPHCVVDQAEGTRTADQVGTLRYGPTARSTSCDVCATTYKIGPDGGLTRVEAEGSGNYGFPGTDR